MNIPPTSPSDLAGLFAARTVSGSDAAAVDRGAGFAALLQQSRNAVPAPAAAPVAPPAPTHATAPSPVVPRPAAGPAAPARPETRSDAARSDADPPDDAPPPEAGADTAAATDAAPPPTPADIARSLLRGKLRTADGAPAARAVRPAKADAAPADAPPPTGATKPAPAAVDPSQIPLPPPLPGTLPDPAAAARSAAAGTASGQGADDRPDLLAAGAPSLAANVAADAPPPAADRNEAATAGAGFAALLAGQRDDDAPAATDAPPPSHAAAVDGPAPLQSAASFSAAPTASMPAPAAVDLATPVGSPDFADHLGVQVAVLAKDGVQQAELHLHPADLGPVSVQITLEGTQARIDFGADVATTRQAIEAGLPQLAGALADAGFTLAGGGVSQHAGGNGGQGGGSDRGDDTARRRRAGTVASIDDSPASRVTQRRDVRIGGLDLYA